MIGQIDIFSYLKEQEPINEPPVLLQAGQEVFLVIKGDVEPFVVLDETWTCGADNEERGYRLIRPSGTYNATCNSAIGKSCFINLEEAKKVAEAYLSEKDVIRAKDIKPVKTRAYSYIRECDSRQMVAFYSELENGMVYMKHFMTYHYIVESGKKAKAIKKFMEQTEFKNSDVKEIEYEPVFKNMHRIRQQYDWDYAEAGHSYAIG